MGIMPLIKVPAISKQVEQLLISINTVANTLDSWLDELKDINRMYMVSRFGTYDDRKRLAQMISPPLPPDDSDSWSDSSDEDNDQIKTLIYQHELEVAELRARNTELYQTNVITEQRLVDQVLDLTIKVDEMEPDYQRYQCIKEFEVVSQKLMDLYGEGNPTELASAIMTNPSPAKTVLGDDAINKYHSLRKTRNLLAHAMI